MNVLLAVRPSLLRVTSVPVKGLAKLQPYSQEIGKERRRVVPTDPGVKPFSAIPGPPSLPIIGTLLDYYKGKYSLQRPYATYSNFQENYGPLVKENVFFRNTLVHVFNPLDFNEVYTSELRELPIRHSHKALKKYRESKKDLYGHIGIAPSNGEDWYNFRYNVMGPSLATAVDGFSLQLAFAEITDDLIEYMKSNLDHNGEITLFPALYYYTLECIGVYVIGTRMGCFDLDHRADVKKFIEAVHESHYAIHQTELKPYILARKAYKTLESSQDYIANFVLKHMNYIYELMELASIRNIDPFDETAKSKDLDIDADNSNPVRLSNSYLYQKLKKRLTKRMLLPIAVDLFQAGVHSTAHSIAFAMYHLAMNPDKQETFREDLFKSFPTKTFTNSGKGVSSLPSIIRESFRLNPPTIGTGRVLVKDLVLSGYHVPKGTKVILHHEVASKNKDYFRDPLKFIPGRKMFPYASNPFIESTRVCMGTVIATKEIKLALKKVFRHFEVSYHYQEVGVVNYLINEPDGPIKLRFKEIPDNMSRQDGTTENSLIDEPDKSVKPILEEFSKNVSKRDGLAKGDEYLN